MVDKSILCRACVESPLGVFEIAEFFYQISHFRVGIAPVDRSLFRQHDLPGLVLYFLTVVDERHTVNGEFKYSQGTQIFVEMYIFCSAFVLHHIMIAEIHHA